MEQSSNPQSYRVRHTDEKAIMAWLPSDEHFNLKKVLKKQGKTITGWVRAMASKEIDEYKAKRTSPKSDSPLL